jgi:hypothetical protein
MLLHGAPSHLPSHGWVIINREACFGKGMKSSPLSRPILVYDRGYLSGCIAGFSGFCLLPQLCGGDFGRWPGAKSPVALT